MVLSVESVTKKYGSFVAVDNVSMQVEKGQIYGLLGPNGAGKTTTIRMIMKILLPDEGKIKIFGREMNDAIRDRIGYLPEERGLYRKMKVKDILLFFGRSRGLTQKEATEAAKLWLQHMSLEDVWKKKVEELSKGMQQKLQFIVTILHHPDLLILDEPFSGLDPINVDLLKDIILELNRNGTTVIFSTHNMEEAEKLCNTICLINKGKVVLEGNLNKIKESYGKNSIIISGDGELSFLKELDYVTSLDLYENYAEVKLKDGAKPGDLLDLLIEKSVVIKKFEVVEPTLRNIFIEQVKGGASES